MTHPQTTETALLRDAQTLSQVIADAFFDLAPSQWLIGDPAARRAVFPGYFRILVDAAFTHGHVVTTPQRDAVALWIRVGPDGPPQPADYSERLAAATGPHLERFQALDEAFEAHHPAGFPHWHLAILAVTPQKQRLGTGTALLHAGHAELDRHQIPAYLEASDPDKRRFYLNHGYEDYGPGPLELPEGGPPMFPMVRCPKSHKQSESAGRRADMT